MKLKLNLLDRAISVFSPEAGLKRARARVATDILTEYQQRSSARRYDGAGHGPRVEGWVASSTGANAENRPAIRTLRDRSRELVRNNPYARRANRVFGTNVVGTGIRPAALGLTKGQKKKLRTAWKAWAETPRCDFDGKRDFYGLQRAAIRAVAESGEVLLVRRRLSWAETVANGGIGIQYQLLESDYIDSNRDGQMSNDGALCIQGIQYDTRGKRVGYWLFNRHPGDGQLGINGLGSTLIPCEDVLHIYEVLRPGQNRGVPFGVSAMLRIRDLDDYEDAQLVRQKIAACYALFVSNDPETSNPANDGSGGEDSETDALPERLQPGTIERLPAGATVTLASPPPVEGYAEYTTVVLRGIASAYGVTYEQLTGDLTNVNFSSARIGRNEFEGFVAELQQDIMISQLCGPCWNWFVGAAFNAGIVAETVVDVKWILPARQLVDPTKEAKALAELVRAGFTPWSDAVMQLGYDPDDLVTALKADNKLFDDNNLTLTTDPRKYTSAGNKTQTGPTGAPVVG